MADHVIETRLLLRYATYAQWLTSEVILAPGEAGVAIFRYTHNLGYSDSEPENTPPAVGLKIGDGVNYFADLPWVQGIAADVYSWAKEENKPTYTADEISGLADYITQHGGGGGSSVSSSNYRIIYDSAASKYILQKYNESTNQWEDTNSNIDLSSILNRINTIERWANGAQTKLGNIELPLAEYIYEEVINYMNTLDYNDVSVNHQFVTSVTQRDGKITVTRSSLSTNDITSGILSTEHGGTGLSQVEDDEVLVGTSGGSITTKKFVTDLDGAPRSAFATVGAIKDFVNTKTEGLTGAMHFIGDATVVITENSHVDPQIIDYNFRNAQPGDVILANGTQEYVWTGNSWQLLGDEGSYAIKGSIRNIDIADDANISQSKIYGLENSLDGKVDKVEGKQLSTNDYTTEEKEKLADIEYGAQVNVIEHLVINDVEAHPDGEKTINLTIPILTQEQINKINNADPNVIEHIFVNGVEVAPETISNQPKSVNIAHVMTEQEVEKLAGIETGAQVNKIETISFNGGEPITPNVSTKNLDITLDTSTLQIDALEGARYPSGNNQYTEIDKDPTGRFLELSKVAATGDIDDLVQTTSYVIFNCGSSTTVI